MGAWESGPYEGQDKKSLRDIIADKAARLITGPVEPMVTAKEHAQRPFVMEPDPQGKQRDERGRFVFEHDEIHHLSITANKHIVVGVEPCDVQERDVIELHPFGGHIVMLVNYIDGPQEAADGKVLLFIQGWPVGRGA